MRLSHNMNSELIYKNYRKSLSQNSTAVEKLSSGLKLNSAKDNPSKITEADNLRISILSRKAASDNAQDTSSMIGTFDGALQEINNNVSRLKDLVVKAGSESNNDEDCVIIQSEIDSILDSINDLANNTEFNGNELSHTDSTGTLAQGAETYTKTSMIGSLAGETIDIPFYDVTKSGLGLDGLCVSGAGKDTDAAIKAVDAAVVQVTTVRSKYGALQTRLDQTQSDHDDINDSLTSAQSEIEDADIGAQAMENSRTQILIQAATSLMAQSNQLPQDALSILATI